MANKLLPEDKARNIFSELKEEINSVINDKYFDNNSDLSRFIWQCLTLSENDVNYFKKLISDMTKDQPKLINIEDRNK